MPPLSGVCPNGATRVFHSQRGAVFIIGGLLIPSNTACVSRGGLDRLGRRT